MDIHTRSEFETWLVQKLLQRLDAQVGVPSAQDELEIDLLMDAVRDVPLAVEEVLALRGKYREIRARTDPEAFHRTVGARLVWARGEAGLTLRDAAARLRLTPAELKSIESGILQPTLREAAGMAQLYDVSLDDLTGDLR